MTRKQHPSADTKTEGIYKRLRDLAFQKGPDAQMPTFRVLCDELETTRVTLGEVLDMLEAENILYRKERQGIFVSPHIYHKTIYILFNSGGLSGAMMSPFWNMLWVRLEQEVQQRAMYKDEQCTMHLVPPQQDEQHPFPAPIMSMIQAGRVDGILSIGLHVPVDGQIAGREVPCVCFASGGSWIVQLNGVEIGRQATLALLQQDCKRIGLWIPDGPTDLEDLNEYRGVRAMLAEQKVKYYPELVKRLRTPPSRVSTQKAFTHQEQGYMLAQEVFGDFNHNRPDGLFIGDDLMTDGALVALEELGIVVGKDVKIATHANVGSPILFGRTKNMVVFEYDINDIVHAMFSMLDTLMSGQKPTEHVTWIRPHLRQ